MSRLILLGVGTGVPDVDRDFTHMVWDGPGGPLLIDAGGSTYQRLLRAGIDPLQLRSLVVTHSHADHINGIPALFFSMRLAGRTEPLTIYGLEPALTLAQQILAAFNLEEYVVAQRWITIEAGDTLPLDSHWILRTTLTDHSRPCLALRFEEQTSGKALVYSCDTAPCPSVAALACGATILIHEATTPEPFPGHTSPRQAGEVAATAGAGRLVLVHFSPHWTMPEAQALDEARAGGFTGLVEIGREYQVLALT